jgi:hypothetical protein
MQNMKFVFIILVSVFLCASAHAKPQLERLLECRVGDAKIGIFSSSEMKLPNVSVFETRNGRHRSVPGKLNFDEATKTYKVTLPSYWEIRQLGPNDCIEHRSIVQAFQLEIVVHRLKVDTHFIFGDPRPDIDLEKLIKNGEAIPVRLTVNCFAKADEELSVSSCLKIQILESRIDVAPPGYGGGSREP